MSILSRRRANLMKFLISLTLLLATICSSGAELPPVAFYVSNELQGIEVDFANNIAKQIDRPVEFHEYQMDQLFSALEEAKLTSLCLRFP